MKTTIAVALGWILAGALQAADPSSRISPEMRSHLDAQKKLVVSWASSPVLVSAVKAQNAKGPIPGMTNSKWKKLQVDDAVVVAFEKNAAGEWLAGKLQGSKGVMREAFLSAEQGEKAAFVTKPTSYLHKGTPKFDSAMSGKVWEGDPEFDKSSASYVVQVAAPVVSGGKPVGVLVVGVSMKSIRDMAR